MTTETARTHAIVENAKTARTGLLRSRKIHPEVVLLWIVVLFAAVIWLMPFVFMVFTSLKSNSDIFANPTYMPPTDIATTNYPDAIRIGALVTAGINSLIIAGVKVPLGLLVSSLCAFALARLRFPYQRLLLALIAMGTMVPIQVVVAPLFRIILGLGLLDTPTGVILPYIAFGVPFQVFILYGFFRNIPREIDEAARIDGASNWQLFWRIIMPLALPALAALFVLDFVATWNEFSIALVILNSQESHTLPLALLNYQQLYGANYGQLNAAITLSVVPVIVVFLRFQRYFVSGAFSGSIKG
jgi:raffinose/stachyose/melibiose transport system permease protein